MHNFPFTCSCSSHDYPFVLQDFAEYLGVSSSIASILVDAPQTEQLAEYIRPSTTLQSFLKAICSWFMGNIQEIEEWDMNSGMILAEFCVDVSRGSIK